MTAIGNGRRIALLASCVESSSSSRMVAPQPAMHEINRWVGGLVFAAWIAALVCFSEMYQYWRQGRGRGR